MQTLRFLKDSAINVGYILFYIITQMIQLAGVVLISIWNDAPWQCIAICLGFLLAKHYSGTQYHAKSMYACSAITWVAFYFLTAAVPPFYISITIPGVMGVALAFVTSWIADLLEGRK
jgi:hypothetical protein